MQTLAMRYQIERKANRKGNKNFEEKNITKVTDIYK